MNTALNILSVGLWICVLAYAPASVRGDTVLPAPVGSQPSGLTTDGTVLYLNSASGFRDIYTLNPSDGAVLSSFPGYFETFDLEFDGIDHIFLTNYAALSVEEITLTGSLVNSFSVPFQPSAIAFDGTELHIFDSGSSAVRVTDRSGVFVRSYMVGHRPSSAVWDASTGHLITVDEFDPNIRVLDTDGNLLDSYPGPHFNTGTGQGGVTIFGTSLHIVGTATPGGNGDRIHVLDTVCGDGDLGPGEQCDDGNITDGDCCSSSCQYEASGSACSDGDPCTVDACDGAGTCVSDLPTGCKVAGRSVLVLKNSADNSKDKLLWKWLQGPTTTPAELGSPTSATTYTLCVHAGSATIRVVLDAGPQWVASGSTGFKFRGVTGHPTGSYRASLKSGNPAKALVKARGANLPDDLAGVLTLPVSVQLVNDTNNVCFEGSYGSNELIKNDGTTFKAKAQ
jgi:cysteine-rich repeat protein